MKALLEQAGNQAVSIRHAFDAVIGSIESSRRKKDSNWRLPILFRGDAYAHVVSKKFPNHLKDDFEIIRSEIAGIRSRLEKPVGEDWDYKNLLAKIEEYRKRITDLQQKFSQLEPKIYSEEREVRYFFDMEAALCSV